MADYFMVCRSEIQRSSITEYSDVEEYPQCNVTAKRDMGTGKRELEGRTVIVRRPFSSFGFRTYIIRDSAI